MPTPLRRVSVDFDRPGPGIVGVPCGADRVCARIAGSVLEDYRSLSVVPEIGVALGVWSDLEVDAAALGVLNVPPMIIKGLCGEITGDRHFLGVGLESDRPDLLGASDDSRATSLVFLVAVSPGDENGHDNGNGYDDTYDLSQRFPSLYFSVRSRQVLPTNLIIIKVIIFKVKTTEVA